MAETLTENWICHGCMRQSQTIVRFHEANRVWSCPPSGWIYCFFLRAFACSNECARKVEG